MIFRIKKIVLMLFVLLTVIACSSDPCDDLKNKAESCLDNDVKALLLKVAKDGVKQECTDYLNSYYPTFDSRCRIEYLDASSDGELEQ
ncbi:MAG: hypothetical protein ACP5KG_05805 [Myxococcota bacterium]